MKVILKNTTLAFNTREKVTKVYEYPTGWNENQRYTTLAPENVGVIIIATTKDDSAVGNRYATFEIKLKAGDVFSIEAYAIVTSVSIYGLLEKNTRKLIQASEIGNKPTNKMVYSNVVAPKDCILVVQSSVMFQNKERTSKVTINGYGIEL